MRPACSPRGWSSCCSKFLFIGTDRKLSTADRLIVHSDMFGDDCVTFKDANVSVAVDGATVSVDPHTRVSEACACTLGRHRLHGQVDL